MLGEIKAHAHWRMQMFCCELFLNYKYSIFFLSIFPGLCRWCPKPLPSAFFAKRYLQANEASKQASPVRIFTFPFRLWYLVFWDLNFCCNLLDQPGFSPGFFIFLLGWFHKLTENEQLTKYLEIFLTVHSKLRNKMCMWYILAILKHPFLVFIYFGVYGLFQTTSSRISLKGSQKIEAQSWCNGRFSCRKVASVNRLSSK